ncbi:hypothetical protein CTAYLR_005812 [Chrysophaeum taylorii]|uniref:Ionotropic glutamate receptor C-terminal domain-containing protein n=1 Tax=Chrysophaeum taylorii TaxID=2483200 RepID=A0AAD7UM69_9STRA|nr:hypothetical protein CTAYLR_005812 [Chrysophaeum taylorii]
MLSTRRACLLLLLLPTVSRSSSNVGETLKGEHLRITVVQDHGFPEFVQMLGPGEVVLPWEEWTGYIIESIDVIARAANFTYTLQAPSGRGNSCLCLKSPTKCDPLGSISDYPCGVDDVIELETSDAYWSMYYVTSERQRNGTFYTTPILSDVGLGAMRLQKEKSLLGQAVLIFRPFDKWLWLCTVLAAVFVAFVLWFTEHGHPPKFRLRSTAEGVEYDVVQDSMWKASSSGEGGYLSRQALTKEFPQAVFSSFYTILSGQPLNPSTMKGDLLNLCWCFFGVIFISSYTANLAAILSTPESKTTDLADLNDKGATVCARTAASYTSWLEKSFPGLDVVRVEAESYYQKLKNGDCAAAVDTKPYLEIVATSKCRSWDELRRGRDNLYVGESLRFGPRDMAVGARNRTVAFALSYWLLAHRSCAREQDVDNAAATCIFAKGEYAEDIWRDHVNAKSHCVEYEVGTKLDEVDFFLPFLLVLAAGIACVLRHVSCFSPKARDRFVQMWFVRNLVDELAFNIRYDSYWVEPRLGAPEIASSRTLASSAASRRDLIDQVTKCSSSSTPCRILDVDALVADFRREKDLRDRLVPSILRHLLKTDVQHWQLARKHHALLRDLDYPLPPNEEEEEEGQQSRIYASTLDKLAEYFENALLDQLRLCIERTESATRILRDNPLLARILPRYIFNHLFSSSSSSSSNDPVVVKHRARSSMRGS